MTIHTLNRTAFETSRLMEFFTEKELTQQIGLPPHLWARALLKELIDNALDACEATGIAPVITVHCKNDYMSITDNGSGMSAELLDSSLDYKITISTNAKYVSPSRGQLGNALKCVYAASFVVDGKSGCVEIETQGRHHQIEIRCDAIQQTPVISNTISEGNVKKGTKITIHWPEMASYFSNEETCDFYFAKKLVWMFEALNPHAEFYLVASDYSYNAAPTVQKLSKWTPQMPTSVHWYTSERLSQLIAAYLSAGQDLPLRKFISLFHGLSGSFKQKAVADILNVKTLSCLTHDGEINRDQVSILLAAMKGYSEPVRPDKLGHIGSAHYKNWMDGYAICDGSFRYRMIKTVSGNMPYVIEMALGIFTDNKLELYCSGGVNYTAMLNPHPFNGVQSMLSHNRVDSFDSVLFMIHVISPGIQFVDRGKSQVVLPKAVMDEIEAALEILTKDWRKIKRQADRDGRARERVVEDSLKAKNQGKMKVKTACYQVMKEAYMMVSSNGALPANARQIMYAARPAIMALTGKDSPWSDDRTFTGKHLPNFVMENPELTASWDVVFDARGHFHEPHTGRIIDLGTLAVRGYMDNWHVPFVESPEAQLRKLQMLSTCGPEGRYGFALFIEKEGFWPLLERAKIAERYDLAIMSTKGMSNTASRTLIEALAIKNVTILVAHDFDRSGFTILHTLFHDTRRYKFKVAPKVIDLGLRLNDALDMGLEAENDTYKTDCDPRELLREQGATEAEANFLVQSGYAGVWRGKRIELNAMVSQVFIDWLERCLQEAGVKKIIPDELLARETYQQAVLRQRFLEQLKTEPAQDIAVPEGLLESLKLEMVKSPSVSWNDVLFDMAKKG